jgi:hypothetical protein
MRIAVILVVVGAIVGGFASIALGVLREDAETVAELELRPSAPGGPTGVGTVRHRNGRLMGWIVVWGLKPGSRHAVHFHGSGAACGTKADPVAIHPDLEADARGVARVRLDQATPASVVERGVYYNVHARPSSASDNPEIACGDVSPTSG